MESSIPPFLEIGCLRLDAPDALPFRTIRAYEFAPHHVGITVFGDTDQIAVLAQMYELPDAAEKFAKDLAFQSGGKPWGKPSAAKNLIIKNIPAGWTHHTIPCTPKRVVHLYQCATHALFIRYTALDLKDPFLEKTTAAMSITPNVWKTLPKSLVFHKTPPPPPEPAPVGSVSRLDLREERKVIEATMQNAIKRFAALQKKRGSNVHNIPVTGIILFYDLANGYLSVNFDVRNPIQFDGSWSHSEFEPLQRPPWQQFITHIFDGNTGQLALENKPPLSITEKSAQALIDAIGNLIVDILQSMRHNKSFAPLLTTPACQFLVEAHDAEFSWPPKREDLGKVNLLA